MRAIFFNGEKLAEISIPKPRPRRGEALIRVHLAGICSTDFEILRGFMSFCGVPGHEFVGTVVSASSPELKGKRVVGEIATPCGRCATCRGGLEKHCPNRSVIGIRRCNGAFAEYLFLPEGNLHIVPGRISDEEAVFTELTASACEIPTRVRVRKESKVAVLGDGRLAAVAAQVLATQTGNIEVFGINKKKLSVIGGLGFQRTVSRERVNSYESTIWSSNVPASRPASRSQRS
jgi:threonine dehydrogenase-like Zn-dependent dehydrogenase